MYNVGIFVDNMVPAGFTSTFSESSGKALDLNDLCVANPASTFFLKVDGFSMERAGITDGDLLVVDRSVTPSNGKIVIAMYNGGFTVKRLLKTSSGLSLMPENPQFKPIVIKDGDDFEVWGVVTFVIKKI